MPTELADLEIVRIISDVHDLKAFDCGDNDLNDFLRNDCLSYGEYCLSHRRIALHEGRVVGFITLLADSIILKTPEKKRLFAFYCKLMYFPAVKIGRLGIALDRQRDGMGRALLRYAIGVAVRMNQELNVGCRFITVDAYPKSIAWYEKNGFVRNRQYTRPDSTHPSMRYDLLGGPTVI